MVRGMGDSCVHYLRPVTIYVHNGSRASPASGGEMPVERIPGLYQTTVAERRLAWERGAREPSDNARRLPQPEPAERQREVFEED